MKKKISHRQLQDIAILCGAAALLVVAAVYISGFSTLRQGAAVVTGTSADHNLTLTASSGTVPSGSSVSLSWTAANISSGGGGGSASTIWCLGDSTTGCFSNTQQQLTTPSAYDAKSFVSGSDTYLVEANNNGSVSNVYKLMTASQCLGNGTTCGTALSTVPSSGGYAVDVATIGSDSYLALANNSGGVSRIFKWQAAQNCFGNGTTCSASLQDITTSSATDAAFFTAGGNTYVTFANYGGSTSPVMVWQSAQNCFGNGTTCGTALSTVPASNPYGVKTYSIGGSTYLFMPTNGSPSKLFVWIPGFNCFGNGSVCGTTLQNITTNGARSAVFYALSGTVYLAVSNSGGSSSPVFKWQAAQNCFGNGTTCGTAFQTLATSGAWGIGFISDGTHVMLGVANTSSNTAAIYNLIASSTCQWSNGVNCGVTPAQTLSGYNNFAGHGWETFAAGGKTYVFAANPSGNAYLYLITPTTCMGNGVACATASVPYYYAWSAGYTGIASWGLNQIFTIGSDTYYAAGSVLEKWTTGGNCPSLGGWGNGSACGTPVQYMNANNPSSNYANNSSEVFTAPDGNRYMVLIILAQGSAGAVPLQSQIFKWTTSCPGGVGWGDGVTCSKPYQYFETNQGGKTTSFKSPDGTQFINVSTNGVNLVYKWTPAGAHCPTVAGASGGIGNGTDCAYGTTVGTNAYQNMSAGGANEVFSIGSDVFLSTTRASSAPGETDIYKWTPSTGTACAAYPNGAWGSGTACNNNFKGWGIFTPGTTAFFSVSPTENYLFVPSAQTSSLNTNTNSFVYKWMPAPANAGQGCFGDGVTCNNVYQNVPTNGTSYVKAYKVGSDIFAYASGLSNSYGIFKWQPAGGAGCPAGGGFGNGGSCNGSRYQPQMTAFTDPYVINGTTFINGGSGPIYVISDASGASGGSPCTLKDSSGNALAAGGGSGNFVTPPLTTNQTFTLSCTMADNSTQTASVTVTVQAAATSITATPSAINSGSAANIAWTTSGIDSGSCTVKKTDPAGAQTTFATADNNAAGQSTGSLTAAGNYTYALNCTTGGGSTPLTKSVTLPVSATASITVPGTGSANVPFNVTWTSSGVTAGSCHVDSPVGRTLWSTDTGSQATSSANAGSYTFTLTCGSALGTVTKTATISLSTASDVPPSLTACTSGLVPPSCSFLAVPSRVQKNAKTTVNWSVTGLIAGQSCSITSNPASGFTPVSWPGSGSTWSGSTQSNGLTSTTIFTLRCAAADGTTNSLFQTVTIIPSFQEI